MQLKVLPRDLQLCADMSSGVDSLGIHQLGDLVKLEAQRVGVIVRLEKENFQILTNSGKVEHVPHQSVQKMREPKFARALDRDDNQLKPSDLVEICDVKRGDVSFRTFVTS